jgi:hypothetical protein
MKGVKGHIYHRQRKWKCPNCNKIRMQEPPSSAIVRNGKDGEDNNAEAFRKEPLPRPRLPADAVQKTFDAEKTATERLQKVLDIYSPKNSDFVYQPPEINAGCWKVIEHLAAFAAMIFDVQAREYLNHHPALVIAVNCFWPRLGGKLSKEQERTGRVSVSLRPKFIYPRTAIFRHSNQAALLCAKLVTSTTLKENHILNATIDYRHYRSRNQRI